MNNLPPGCSTSSIPGNRPEDIAWENFWNETNSIMEKANPILWNALTYEGQEEIIDALCAHFYEKMQNEYAIGYTDRQKEEKYKQKWIPCKYELPEKDPESNYGDFQHSIGVLATDGKNIYHAYYEFWDDPEYFSKWKQCGRDGYTIESKITHWMNLPELP